MAVRCSSFLRKVKRTQIKVIEAWGKEKVKEIKDE